ncbi:MAG: dTDP-4-dehydrorhamnose 3,5-epimerase [Coxiella sp. (in: Bacteria)]|nr:MAG: dTDP-4-dehydrorhamnose 3,5-epimerase [Coxiella sp. (in: g-proteobacteria)]
MSFTIETTAIPDVKLITPDVFRDERGFFMESYRADAFEEAGIATHFLQDNLSCSDKGILRGLHYQLAPYEQGKLVSVIQGRLFDVAVDIRKESPTFGQWVGYELSSDNHAMLWIPPGCAHGFLVLEDATITAYKCTQVYDVASERSILWSDPDINIQWPSVDTLTISEKDKAGTRLISS